MCRCRPEASVLQTSKPIPFYLELGTTSSQHCVHLKSQQSISQTGSKYGKRKVSSLGDFSMVNGE